MLAIGLAAGAASFTHVHDVAAAHGQDGWIAAAIPALGFLVMVKIALAQTHATSVSATDASTAVTSTSAGRRAATPAAAREVVAMIDPALMSAARDAAGRVADEGHRVSQQRLADALRKDGYAVSNARASELLRALKAEAPARTADDGMSRRLQPQPRGLTHVTNSRDAGRTAG